MRRLRRKLGAAAAIVVCVLASGLASVPAGAQPDDDAVEKAAEDSVSDDSGAGVSAALSARVPEPPPRYTDDPWADPVLRWPDPLAESQLGVEPTYYWFAREDRRSRLAAATPDRPLRVWAGGDSISGGPVYGFRQLIADDGRFVFTEDIQTSTGVVTDWYFDWVAYMNDEITEGPYDVIVLAMGANDKQRFRDHPERPGEPAWDQRYQARVAELVSATVRPGRLVIWVGLPPLGTRYLSDLPGIVNPLAEAAVSEIDGAIFVDSYETLAAEGRFAAWLDGEHGRRRIRTQDGVHYTLYGGLVLTEPILAEIHRRSG